MLSHVWLFTTPWTAARKASLTFISQSLFKLISIESLMPSNHLILCHPLLFLPSSFLSIRVFPVSQLFISGGWIIGTSASASVPVVNTQGWFPLGLTGLISLPSKGLSRVFSSIIVWRHQFFSVQPFYCPALTSIHDYWTLDNHAHEVASVILTLCNSMDYSPPGSYFHGILQARILEWVAIPFSWPRNWTHVSYISWIGRQFLYH